MVMPGDNIQMEITLIAPIAMEKGLRFAIREGGHTVGATTGPDPTSGLVVYDLRTCAQAIKSPEPKKQRTRKAKAKEEAE